MNALELRGIHKAYPGSAPILRGVDLAIPEGTITALLGLNGSGKTTTIRILLGLTPAGSGSVAVLGTVVDPIAPEHKAMIGAVLDEPLFFDRLSPRDYLFFVGRLRGLTKRTTVERIDELFALFDLEDARYEPIRTFSTGMKKKVSLAAAIIHRPSILVLDEPFEGIDPMAARDIRETLRMFASRGAAVLVTSHILDTVERVCTHLAVLHQGRIVLHADATTVGDMAAALAGAAGDGVVERVFLSLVSTGAPKEPPAFLS